MRFGEAVFREAVRLKSTAPLHLRRAARRHDASAGVELPAGHARDRADAPGRGATRRRALRPRPLARPTAHDPKTFLPFGAGPRFCPGRNLAFLEGKTALAMLARNFEIELAGAAAARALRLHDEPDRACA